MNTTSTGTYFAFRRGGKLKWFGPNTTEHEAKEEFQQLYGFWPGDAERTVEAPSRMDAARRACNYPDEPHTCLDDPDLAAEYASFVAHDAWPHALTIDYVTVVPGLAVWDYNLQRTTVESVDHIDNTGKPWFRTENGGQFDGSRMWVRHPSSGQPA